MKKLELKNIAPYLPYGLKCKYIDEDNQYILDAVITETNQDKRLLQLFHVLEKNNASSCKIILRPLSEVLEVIKQEFEKYHDNIAYDKDVIEFFCEEVIGDLDGVDELKTDYLPYGGIVYLLKNHYDIFDLIPEGLAIDINTLNK